MAWLTRRSRADNVSGSIRQIRTEHDESWAARIGDDDKVMSHFFFVFEVNTRMQDIPMARQHRGLD